MSPWFRTLRRALLAGLALAGAAGAAPVAQVEVSEAWVRATVEGQTGSGAYMRLTSRADAQLVGAASPVAEKVEIHEMHTVGDRMTMRQIERLALPAGTPVALGHGYHVMLIGLRHQLLAGQQVPITLHLLDAHGARFELALQAPVRPLGTPVPHD
jgi:copper(I)-binding protein